MKYRRLICMLLIVLLSVPASGAWAAAPDGIQEGYYDLKAELYLPSTTDGELTRVTDTLRLSTAFSPEESVLRHLLEYPADASHRSLPGDGIVHLADGLSFIMSRDTAAVSFSPEYGDLDASSRYLLAQCVTNTLCALGRVRAVVVLCEGAAVSLSDEEEIPAGAYRASEEADLPLVQAQLMARRKEESALRYSADTALYYPAQAGHGILCETRSVTFAEPGEEQTVRTLLEALSEPPHELFGIPEMPQLSEYLIQDPQLRAIDDDTRAVEIRFSEDLNQAISSAGILRSVLLAAITTTITSFLPDTRAVTCYIGTERVGGLVPVGLYERANENIIFENGRMRWQDYAHFHLTECRMYYVDDRQQLTETLRTLPSDWADSPEKLLTSLLDGPNYYDSAPDLQSPFPKELTADMILGIGTANEVCELNLKAEAFAQCAEYTAAQERNLLYSLVNTLTCLPWCRRVQVWLDGTQPDTLIHDIYLPGSFMRNADYQTGK